MHIPARIKEIGKEAFYKCKELETVTFAEGSQLKTIGNYAFYSCDRLSVSLPEGLNEISDCAFYECGFK